MFASAIDIANRALQHCGTQRIVTFEDVSKNATEVAFAYDKLRRVVLRRNVWRFAVRKAALRAITSTTQLFAPSVWASGTTYALGALVSYSPSSDIEPIIFVSLASSNTGNTPSDTSLVWQVFSYPVNCDTYSTTLSYYVREIVVSSGHAYLSLINTNLNNAVTDTSAWAELTGTITPLELFFPIGTGPITTPGTKNLFRLPNYFMRQPQQDPRGGIMGVPGAPSGVTNRDWDLLEDYIATNDVGPIIYRYTGDVIAVPAMDDLFCEALALRVAIGVSETLTQSASKIANLVGLFRMAIMDARAVNSIETGSTEMPETDFYLLGGQQQQPQQQERGQ
jgi:hypothetical protein